MARTGAQIEISAGTSRLASGLNAAKRMFTTWGTGVARGIGGAFKAANKMLQPGDTMKNAAGHLGGDIMGRGLDAIMGGADEVRNFERNLVRMQIATDGNATSTANLRKQIGEVSKATGVSRAEVLAGAQAYVGFTGDAAGAADAAALFARVSAATGSSTADVAQAMSALKSSMGITAKEGEAAFSALIVQGKGGAVEVKDMASELAGLAPQFALFKGGKGVQGLREMGAGFQVIMKNASSASDAATKYSALMGSFSDAKTLKELKKLGVQVTDNNGKLLDASTIFENVAKNKKLFEGTNLSTVFGRKEAQLAVLALREHIGTYRDLRDAAQDTGAVQRDMNTFMESDAGRLDKAFNDVKLAIAEAFTPERIKGFTNAVVSLSEKLGPMVDMIGKGADALGGLVNVGKSIRGSIGGNGGRSFLDIKADEAMAANQRGRNSLGMLEDKDPYTAQQVAGAKSRLEDDKARARAQAAILGSEKGERTTKESVRAAVLAANSGKAYGQGKLGEQMAGEQYLQAAGVSADERAKIEQQIFKDLADAIPKSIIDGFANAASTIGNPTVQIGDNQVARSADKGTDARRGTR